MEQELRTWEDNKRAEKAQATAADAMDGVCRTLPGLWRAEKIQKKAAHGHGETVAVPDLNRALRTDTEALAACLEAGAAGDTAKALGRLLYTAVRAARLAGVDPEKALHDRCEEAIVQARKTQSSTE